MKPLVNIVWYKRDFRLSDHAPLKAAIEEGLPVLLISFFEPSLITAPQYADRHWRFQMESIVDLNQQLLPYRSQVHLFHREVIPVLAQLTQHFNIRNIFSHQETGLKISYDRDLAVAEFCRQHTIIWQEFRQDGVFRGLKNRVDWEKKWEKDMKQPLAWPALDQMKPLLLESELYQQLAGSALPKLYHRYQAGFQQGGSSFARRYWQSFLDSRINDYSRFLSKPEQSRKSCSRLSPYIAYGNISVREIFQTSALLGNRPKLDHQRQNFQSRVWWRSHYIQKLESEWQIEMQAINPALRAIDRHEDQRLLNAWSQGRTGLPMVDASIRCLEATGWINFRMRAMLATYATFGLWLDWRPVALRLANLFTDFEPGIHYGQIQMQAGLTGYHTLRIFNPIVQAKNHDPEGHFVRKWVPELAKVPAPQIYEPWKMPLMEQQFYTCIIGKDYPAPILPYQKGTSKHRDRYWTFRQQEAVKKALPKVWQRHCLPQNIEDYKKSLK